MTPKTAPAAEPRRLTPTERLDAERQRQHDERMASLTRTASPPEHSVTISRNAKGVAQFEVTIRGFDPLGVAALAERIYDGLAAGYPYSANGGSE